VFDGAVSATLLAGVGIAFMDCWDCCVDVAIVSGGVEDNCCDVAAADDEYVVEEDDAWC
jgi:hypothetical protein